MPSILTKNDDDDDPRYSFNRIDDDLCEVLLSYLSLEEKFRYECVSKQFQRCIYEKQNRLKLDFKLKNKMKRTNLLGAKCIDLHLFESILKKCPNIHQINVDTMKTISEANYQQMIELIIKNCNYLSSFDFYFTETLEEVFTKFFIKFGPKIKKINFNSESNLSESQLILCKNLIEIDIKRVNAIYLRQIFFEVNDISFKKVKKIQLKCSALESDYFQTFVHKCHKTLESIDISIHAFDENTVIKIFDGLKQLKNLKSLKIDFDYNIIINFSIVKHLKQMAINCQNLKIFEMTIKTKNLSQNLEVFNAIKHFKQLKTFGFRFDYSMKVLKAGNHFTCHSLKGCHQLTHLKINGSRMFDVFFEDISLYLPKLEYLSVSNAKVSETSFQELSKLKNLRSLTLHLYQINSVKHIDKVIDNCKKLHLIDLLSYGLHVVLDELEIEEIREEPDTLDHFLRIDLK